MKINPLFQTLNYQNSSKRRTNLFGQDYFLLPLPAIMQDIELSIASPLSVKEQHLSCYEMCVPENEYSDIHYTVELENEQGLFKAHVFFRAKNHCARVNLIDLAHPEHKIELLPEDEVILKTLAEQQSELMNNRIHQDKKVLIDELKLNYQALLKRLELTLFDQENPDISSMTVLEELVDTLSKLSVLSPNKYPRILKRFQIQLSLCLHPINELIEEKIAGAAPEIEEIEPEWLESTQILFGPKRNKINEELVVILRQSMDLLALLYQKPNKVNRNAISNSLSVADDFIEQVETALALLQALNAQVLAVSQYKLRACHLKTYAQINFNLCQAEQLEHDLCLDLLKTMLSTSDYRQLDLVIHKSKYLSCNLFYTLIKKDAGDVLVKLIVAAKVNIHVSLSKDKPYSIIEEIIREKKMNCFSAIHQQSLINLLKPCSDQRPLVSLILEMNPVNPIRKICTTTHAQFSSVEFFKQAKKSLSNCLLQSPHLLHIIQRDMTMLGTLDHRMITVKKTSPTAAALECGFFADARAELESKSFLHKPWVQEKITAYHLKNQAFKRRLERSHQSQLFRLNQADYSDIFSEERTSRLKYLLEFMTEDDARMSLDLMLTNLELNIDYFEVSEEIRLKGKSLGKTKLKALTEKAQDLKHRIDSYQKINPTNPDNMEYPGITGKLLQSLKKIDYLIDKYNATHDGDLVMEMLVIMNEIPVLVGDTSPDACEFIIQYIEKNTLKLLASIPSEFRSLLNFSI